MENGNNQQKAPLELIKLEQVDSDNTAGGALKLVDVPQQCNEKEVRSHLEAEFQHLAEL